MARAPARLTLDDLNAPLRVALGLGAGVVVSVIILLGLARAQRTGPVERPEFQDIRTVQLPAPPPPPTQSESLLQRPPPEIDVEQSPVPVPGAIRVAAAPPVPTFQPAADMQFDFSPDAFRPSPETSRDDGRRVFKQSEVDQRVVVLRKKAPSIPAWLLKEVENPRVTVLMVVNTDGSVENVHLLKSAHPEFDRLVLEAVVQWKFRPARKGGKTVRQWLQLPVYVKPPQVDHFSM